MTVRELAKKFYEQFEVAERNNGERYWRVKEDCPVGLCEQIKELCHRVHGDMLPDDYKYEVIVETLEYLASNDPGDYDLVEFADSGVNVYTSDLLKWLNSNLKRIQYVDEAKAELGSLDTLMDDIMQGQYVERREISYLVFCWLEDSVRAKMTTQNSARKPTTLVVG